MTAMERKIDSVALIGHAMQRNLLTQLAQRLKERAGCAIHLYCNGPMQKRFFTSVNVNGLFTSINFKAPLVNCMYHLVTAAARQARSLAPGARATRWNQLR